MLAGGGDLAEAVCFIAAARVPLAAFVAFGPRVGPGRVEPGSFGEGPRLLGGWPFVGAGRWDGLPGAEAVGVLLGMTESEAVGASLETLRSVFGLGGPGVKNEVSKRARLGQWNRALQKKRGVWVSDQGNGPLVSRAEGEGRN